MRSAISYQFVPLYAAKLVERKDVDTRETILLKKALGMAMNSKPNAVQNIYGTMYKSLGDMVAEAGTKLRKNTRALKDQVTKGEEHMLFEQKLIAEERLQAVAPQVYDQYMRNMRQGKKEFNKARASVTVLSLIQRLMLRSASGHLHPCGSYKIFDCVFCEVDEDDLPNHWQHCPEFQRELKKLVPEVPDHYIRELNEPDNNILLQPKEKQAKMIGHYTAIASVIEKMEGWGVWFTRNHIYSTKQAKADKPEPLPPPPTQAMELDDGVTIDLTTN